jgi:hypothetical protein
VDLCWVREDEGNILNSREEGRLIGRGCGICREKDGMERDGMEEMG